MKSFPSEWGLEWMVITGPNLLHPSLKLLVTYPPNLGDGNRLSDNPAMADDSSKDVIMFEIPCGDRAMMAVINVIVAPRIVNYLDKKGSKIPSSRRQIFFNFFDERFRDNILKDRKTIDSKVGQGTDFPRFFGSKIDHRRRLGLKREGEENGCRPRLF